ncbi:DUF58 domain-containing protein [Falsibacillus albus]|uniref:DUF58 domain-containing protein n=1 Tax=Falsibacillus albus TaxID=2478915 RepID=A0A3L7JM43_9BACI|nr:DUF58 domain-containing protein [Falsibacillus albus]RLQ91149.1 DUF58 domain-containing protein [Falsibacillus albus]
MKRTWQWIKSLFKTILLFVFLGLAFSYSMFQGGFVSWFLFYSFLPFGVYSVLLAFYPLADIEVERMMDKHGDLRSGDSLTVTIHLKRRIPFPLFFLVVEDVMPESLQYAFPKSDRKIVLFPGFKRESKFVYTIKEIPRGEHFLTNVRLKTADAIGLIEKEAFIKSKAEILVYPAYIDMMYRSLESRYDQGMTSSKVKLQKDTSMVSGIREYQPGDRVSWVHWKATAKTNTIMTKEFEEKESHDVLIVLDRSPSESFELMVKFTASITRAILRRNAQVGMISMGKDPTSFPIRGGDYQRQQLFYHLAKVAGDSPFPLEKVLTEEVSYFQQAVTMIVITSKLTQEVIESASSHAKRRGVVALFVIRSQNQPLSPEELNWREMASARGIWVRALLENEFVDAFKEVKRA